MRMYPHLFSLSLLSSRMCVEGIALNRQTLGSFMYPSWKRMSKFMFFFFAAAAAALYSREADAGRLFSRSCVFISPP